MQGRLSSEEERWTRKGIPPFLNGWYLVQTIFWAARVKHRIGKHATDCQSETGGAILPLTPGEGLFFDFPRFLSFRGLEFALVVFLSGMTNPHMRENNDRSRGLGPELRSIPKTSNNILQSDGYQSPNFCVTPVGDGRFVIESTQTDLL
jgi:hypothetical protein